MKGDNMGDRRVIIIAKAKSLACLQNIIDILKQVDYEILKYKKIKKGIYELEIRHDDRIMIHFVLEVLEEKKEIQI